MADMRRVEEGSAFPEQRKLYAPNSINKDLEEKKNVNEEDNSNSNKKQKLDITPEKAKDIIFSYVIDDEVVESKDGKENSKSDETNDKDEYHEVEPETVGRISAADKGKWKLIEEFEEEEDDEVDDEDFIDDSDFSDGLDTHSEDDMI